jgi:hypothetical protein
VDCSGHPVALKQVRPVLCSSGRWIPPPARWSGGSARHFILLQFCQEGIPCAQHQVLSSLCTFIGRGRRSTLCISTFEPSLSALSGGSSLCAWPDWHSYQMNLQFFTPCSFRRIILLQSPRWVIPMQFIRLIIPLHSYQAHHFSALYQVVLPLHSIRLIISLHSHQAGHLSAFCHVDHHSALLSGVPSYFILAAGLSRCTESGEPTLCATSDESPFCIRSNWSSCCTLSWVILLHSIRWVILSRPVRWVILQHSVSCVTGSHPSEFIRMSSH